MYTRNKLKKKAILIVWVDDLIIAATNEDLLCDVNKILTAKFKMKDPGKLRLVTMSQKKYILKVLKRLEPKRCREAVGSLIYIMTCTRPDLVGL